MKIASRWVRATPGRGAEAGGALVLSLIAVVVVVMLAGSFTQYASSVSNRQAQAVDRKQAFYMAEAGLAESYAGLMCGKSGNVGTKAEPAAFGEGLFWVEVTELQVDVLQVDSTGMVGSGLAKLSVVAERGEESVASLGVFSNSLMTLAPGSVIDAFDSTKGAYESQVNHSGAHLGSNDVVSLTGTVELPTVVKGSVTPGPGLSVSTSGSVTISGSTEPALEAAVLPPVELPKVELGAAQSHDSPYPLVLPPGESGYEGLKVASGSQVVLQGPAVVVVASLQVHADAELVFDTSAGPVHLYVTEALDLAEGSVLTTSSTTPEDVIIQVPGETLEPVALRAISQFHGVLYAPEAELVVASSFEVFGALVGELLSFEGPVQFHFDRNLAEYSAAAALPEMLSWRILELASSSTDLTTSPFKILGVDGSLLPRPRDAHQDQVLEIDYMDKLGLYHTYLGLESQFDWNVVDDVLAATRDGEQVLMPRQPAKIGMPKSPGVVPIVDGPML